MKSVYLETTVVGHIAGRLHRDAIILARQAITREWWANGGDALSTARIELSSR